MFRQTPILLVSVLLLAVVAVCVRGCGHYGEVNAKTFGHAKALYSICNRRDAEWLDASEGMIAESESSAEISSKEAGYLREIIATARAEDWQEAQQMARQLMSDQADR